MAHNSTYGPTTEQVIEAWSKVSESDLDTLSKLHHAKLYYSIDGLYCMVSNQYYSYEFAKQVYDSCTGDGANPGFIPLIGGGLRDAWEETKRLYHLDIANPIATPKRVAALIRGTLKRHFPETQFKTCSVRRSVFSGDPIIDVEWTEQGPSSIEVARAIAQWIPAMSIYDKYMVVERKGKAPLLLPFVHVELWRREEGHFSARTSARYILGMEGL